MVIETQILMGFAPSLSVATQLLLVGAAAQIVSSWPSSHEHNPFLDYFLAYILVFAVLGARGAGKFARLDC